MNYVELDVHKEYCDATVLDEYGVVVKREKFKYTRKGFEEFFKGRVKKTEALRAKSHNAAQAANRRMLDFLRTKTEGGI
jgi:hypothetical protein